MSFQNTDGVRYFQFASLGATVTHAIFTRLGGISEGPYAELNVGATVGDEPSRVEENLSRSFSALGLPRNSLFDSWLVHGTHVLIATAPRPPEWARPPQADIVMTNRPEVTLFMRFADCVPMVYFDPVKKAVALAHAGWRGTLQGVALNALEAMKANYNSRAEDLLVGIGPAISVEKYEVGPDVAAEVRKIFGYETENLLPRTNGQFHFDLVGVNRRMLEQAGVKQIELSNLCTATDTNDWFSHRASGGKTGRFGALIALK
ncbi:MAG: peptidoglycan editing factor PgeF [Chloroflexi bacterium]|nr:peptidoglycan editing factor PgeF [Chloroflexota bacterium]